MMDARGCSKMTSGFENEYEKPDAVLFWNT